MKKVGWKFTASVITFLLITPFCMATVDLGAAGAYTVLGLENTTVSIGMRNAIITGDVGISAFGFLQFDRGTIDGSIYLDADASYSMSGQANHINGSLFTDLDLSAAVADATAASTAAAGLAPTETFGTIDSDQTITGTGGENVINVDTLNMLSGDTLTLSGGASDIFVLNVLSQFTSGQNSAIVGDGIDPSQIIINLLGNASIVKGTINGTLLAVGENITLQGTLNGAIIAGAVEVGSVDIESIITGSTFAGSSPVPEPATLVLLGLGSLTLLRRRI